MGLSAAALSNVALASQIGGGITSAFGAYGQASTQRANLGAQAAVAEANARISELGAQAELADSNQRIANATQRYGQLKSSQRAAMAANGIAIDQGSAADVLASTDELKAQDRATLEVNAMRAAFGQRMQASNQRSQAAMSRANAGSINPLMAGATSLMGSAGRVASSWYQFSGGSNGSAQTLAPAGDPIGALYELNNGWR